MKQIDTIRAALQSARVVMSSEDKPQIIEALAALAELERAAAEPVATVCLITDRFAHNHCIEAQLQVDPGAQLPIGTKLYAAQPAPVAEIREPTDDECRNIWREAKANEGDGSKVCAGRAMFDAVRAVLWPKEGL